MFLTLLGNTLILQEIIKTESAEHLDVNEQEQEQLSKDQKHLTCGESSLSKAKMTESGTESKGMYYGIKSKVPRAL